MESNLPYFNDMIAFNLRTKQNVCAHNKCDEKGEFKCSKDNCKYTFCKDHCNHVHLGCYWIDTKTHLQCNNFGQHPYDLVNIALCNSHFKIVQESRLLTRYAHDLASKYMKPNYDVRKCETCKIELTKHESIFCGKCSAKWYNLKLRGISGAYGS